MSQGERTGIRDLLYSRWHRYASIKRFVGIRVAAQLKVIDIDWCEACNACDMPVALIETQCSESKPKPARITTNLARLAGVPAYSVSYTRSDDGEDIELFQVQQIAPEIGDVLSMLPSVYAYWLWSLRDSHRCQRDAMRSTDAA